MCARNVETRTEADLAWAPSTHARIRVRVRVPVVWRYSVCGLNRDVTPPRPRGARSDVTAAAAARANPAKCRDPEGIAGRRGFVAFMGIHARGQ